MGTRHKSTREGPRSRLSPALCLLLLAGCEGMASRSGMDRDPLTGGGPPIPREPVANQAAPVAATTPANPLPAMPAPASTTSQAALTGGGANPSLDPGRDLRIGTGLGSPAPANWPSPNSPNGAVLHSPQPVNDGYFQQTGSQAPPAANIGTASPSAGGGDGYQQLQTALNARGVTWRRLETVGDSAEWKFSCSVPNAQNPNVRHYYEGRGTTDVNAIRSVLDQIDRERRAPS